MVKKARPPQYFTRVLPPSEQATGSFDRGAITEQKMIGFAGEGSVIHRVGPLYYWAWAQASTTAAVEAHPHRGFEIMSYVLQGTIEHRDSLGTQSQVGAGGVQLMQTGSGLEHEEAFVQVPAESLQIWWDPQFRQQLDTPPRYHSFTAEQFPQNGPAKIIVGAGSPIQLVTPDVEMQDLMLTFGAMSEGLVKGGCGWLAIVLQGAGRLVINAQSFTIQARDFIVHQGEHDTTWTVTAAESLRLLWMRVPLVLPYALFPKPRG